MKCFPGPVRLRNCRSLAAKPYGIDFECSMRWENATRRPSVLWILWVCMSSLQAGASNSSAATPAGVAGRWRDRLSLTPQPRVLIRVGTDKSAAVPRRRSAALDPPAGCSAQCGLRFRRYERYDPSRLSLQPERCFPARTKLCDRRRSRTLPAHSCPLDAAHSRQPIAKEY